VHGGGSGAATRFAAVFVASESIVGRTFTTTGTTVPALAAFDSYVRAMMQADNIRAASLAVVKDGRLMLARGYTWAEPGFPVTQPTSLFRIASAAKSLTSIGIHRAMEREPRSIHDLRTMLSFFPAISPFDARTRDIKLVDLLTHRGGWNSDIAGDPLFADEFVAAYHQNSVPVTKDEIYRYMTLSQPLQFTPGTSEVYSNYGFTMLGKVLEELNPGLTYETVIRRDVFSPLGVVRPKIGGSTFSQIGSDEVPYDPLYPGVWLSVAHSIRPWVPGGYGTWNQRNLDSCGGWVMATCDYAAVLAALSLGDQCPILGRTSIDHMWSPNSPSKPDTLRGWWKSPVVSHGQPMVFRSHNGGLAGSGTLCALRSDGFGFCLFLNQNRFAGLGVPEMNDLSLLADLVQQWPNHDLFPSVSIPSLRTRIRGVFLPYGAGCAGTAGTPVHAGRGEPEVGQSHQLEVANAPAETPFLAMVGLSRSEWNGIGLPLPLAILGAPGCSLLTGPTLTFGGITGRTGVGAVTMTLPDNPIFLGAHLYTQMAVVDPGANQLGLAFSNGVDAQIGGWR
jgi:CubicO group peptidase (beta-lactamase class C family)